MLTWKRALEIELNVEGYKIYRSEGGAYSLYKVVLGYNTESYIDEFVTSNKTYSYYIMAFNSNFDSDATHVTSCKAPDIPNPVAKFEAKYLAFEQVDLIWNNAALQEITYTVLERRNVTKGTPYEKIAKVTSDVKSFEDKTVEKGNQYQYRVAHGIDRAGVLVLSNWEYDFIMLPYRNPNTISNTSLSRIYLDQSQIKDYESWLHGRPEFYIEIGVVSNGLYSKNHSYDVQYPKRDAPSADFDLFIKDWTYISWFDAISINIIEYDEFNIGGTEITVNAKAFEKDTTDKKTDVTLKLLEENVSFGFHVSTKTENIGFNTTVYNDPLNRIFKVSYGVRFEITEIN